MKKQLFLGLLLVAGVTSLNAKPRSVINRIPIHTGLVRNNKNHKKSWNSMAASLGSKIAPMERGLQKAQTKFINKIIPAAYEFAADYIQVMHSQNTHKMPVKTDTNAKLVINQYNAAQRAYNNAMQKFLKSKIAKEYRETIQKFNNQNLKTPNSIQKLREKPIVKKYREQFLQLRKSSKVAKALQAARKKYNNLPLIQKQKKIEEKETIEQS